MKLFIASDIHGSAYYTDLLLDRYRKSAAERIILLGDVLYHGPRNDLPRDYAPKRVAAALNAVADRILAVRGNCDAEVDGMILDFDISSDRLVILDGNRVIRAVHGHHEERTVRGGDILLCGHTHVPAREMRDGNIYINPGSISIPKEASPHSYMTFENGVFRWYDLNTAECYMEYRS